jgi:hypothetical protein
MTIEIIDAKEQNIFVHLKADENPIFFTQPYHQFEQSCGYQTGFFKSNNNTFMPFRVYKKLFFRFIQIMYPPINNGHRLSVSDEKNFLNEAVALLKSQKKYHRIIQPFVWDVFYAYPNEATFCPFGQLYSNLENNTEAEIFEHFSPKYRNAIRKVLTLSHLVSLKYDAKELIHFYQVYQEVHAKQQVYFDQLSHFQKMQQFLGEKHFLLTNLYFDARLEGGAVISYTKNEANYLYGGARNPTLQNGSIKLLQFEIIKQLKKVGVKKYIWGGCRLSDVTGSKQQGMQEFKLRFGAQIKKGFLWKMDINPFYCFLYDYLMNLQLKLKGQKPSTDVIDYEKNRTVIIE